AAEKAAADKKKLADAKAKAAAEKAQLDKLRDLELKRITGAAGTAGNAEKSSAPKIDAGYVARLTALIKSNTTYAGSTDQPGNPKVTFRVELLPTGEILSVRLAKSSGVPQFDDAVERGINKSSPLPKKKDGTVERNLVVNFSMKDLD
ncbi:MAG: cell envelope integrity protein TolA, partial [Pseudomonadota bacterium]